VHHIIVTLVQKDLRAPSVDWIGRLSCTENKRTSVRRLRLEDLNRIQAFSGAIRPSRVMCSNQFLPFSPVLSI
jgi:hypothetical protein